MALPMRPQRGCPLLGQPDSPEFEGGFDTITSMQDRGPQNPYEAYCYQCNVSAPVDMRRCVHCGGRLASERNPQRSAFLDVLKKEFAETDEEGEELATSVGSAAPKVVMWILLLIGGSLYQYCN
jgi:hypothetical protein